MCELLQVTPEEYDKIVATIINELMGLESYHENICIKKSNKICNKYITTFAMMIVMILGHTYIPRKITFMIISVTKKRIHHIDLILSVNNIMYSIQVVWQKLKGYNNNLLFFFSYIVPK